MQNKTILGEPLPAVNDPSLGSTISRTETANCPGCGRAISYGLHELPLTIECAQCKTCFDVGVVTTQQDGPEFNADSAGDDYVPQHSQFSKNLAIVAIPLLLLAVVGGIGL